MSFLLVSNWKQLVAGFSKYYDINVTTTGNKLLWWTGGLNHVFIFIKPLNKFLDSELKLFYPPEVCGCRKSCLINFIGGESSVLYRGPFL